MGNPALASDTRFGTFAARQAHHVELDRTLGAWTREFEPRTIEDRLQAAGVPAYIVQNTFDMAADTQLAHRGHFVQTPHTTLGRAWVENSRYQLSRTPARIERGAPTLGESNQYVLEQILGYSDEHVAELVGEGALG
jgi:benzylsuccinate CoA-transferase BbsF subunit